MPPMNRDDEENTSISLESGNSYELDFQGESEMSLPMPRERQQRRPSRRSSCVSRRSSGVIAFEFHDSLIFDELSAMIDEEQAQETNNSAALLNKEITANANSHNSSSTGGSSSLGLPRVVSEMSLASAAACEDDNDDAPIVTKIERNIIGREIRAGNKLVRTRSDASFADSARFPRTGSAMGLSSSGCSRSTSRLSRNRVASYLNGGDTQQEQISNLSALQNASFGRKGVKANKSAASAGRALLGAPSPSPGNKRRSSSRKL